MNTERFQRQMEEAKIAREMIELAGMDVETALVSLDAVSDDQRNFGGDMRHHALALIWTQHLKESFRTPDFAATLIRAVNHHTQASWWCNFSNRDGALYDALKPAIKEERAK